MVKRGWRILGVLLAIAIIFVACGSPHTEKPLTLSGSGGTYTIPSYITCSGDQSANLSSFLNGLPSNSIVNFPSSACYNVSTSVTIDNDTGLTIHGNGSTITQDVAVGTFTTTPVMNLYQDNHLTINNLTVAGSYNGSNGGPDYEGAFGYLLEANVGVMMNNDTTETVQGDFMELNAPDSGFTTQDNLNTSITVTNSTFYDAGYHGLTVESANGVRFNNDNFTAMGTDGMDFEYDTYSTGFGSNGQPFYAAEDNIVISNCSWTDIGVGDWFASIQMQTPGVAEHNITLANNTINSPIPAVDAEHTATGSTTAPYGFTGFHLVDNVWNPSFPIAPFASAMTFTYIGNLTLSHNSIPLSNPGPPAYYAMQLNAVYGAGITTNTFVGAEGVLYPTSSESGLTQCGNYYGATGATLDFSC